MKSVNQALIRASDRAVLIAFFCVGQLLLTAHAQNPPSLLEQIQKAQSQTINPPTQPLGDSETPPAGIQVAPSLPTNTAVSPAVGDHALQEKGDITSAVKVQRPSEAGTQVLPGVILRFENADVTDIVQAILGDILHLNYLIDPSIQVRVTLQSAGSISPADVYGILESVLSLHGISIVRDGKLYKVIRDIQANRDATIISAGEGSPLVQVIPLKYVQASGLVGALKNVLGPQSHLAPDSTNRHLILVDRANHVAKVLDLLKTLDVDYLAKVHIQLVQITKGDASDIAKEMDALFRTSGMFNWAGTESNKIYFLPLNRNNAILVAASSESMLQTAEKWIKTLDDEPKSGIDSFVHLYMVANSSATRLADLVSQVYGAAASAGQTPLASSQTTTNPTAGNQPTAPVAPTRIVQRGAQGSTTGNVQIIPDEATNTLIVRASPQDYQQIRRILERLDVVPNQVMIQVMVAEVDLTDRLQYGVEWWLRNLKFSHNGKTNSAQAGLDTGLVGPAKDLNPVTSTATGGVASGLNYLLFNSAGDITGLFNLLATDTDVNLLSSPHVMATDGRVAKIEIGSEEPVVTQTVSTPGGTVLGGTTTSNSVQYRPTGILLEVKPSISSSGRVNLQFSQEVSSRGGDVLVGGSIYPSFTKRKVSTDVTLEEGKTLVVAGLIQDKGNRTSQGVPFLKDVPLFGALFGTQTRAAEKTELLISITPFIVRNRAESERLTESLQDSLLELKKRLPRPKLIQKPNASQRID